MLSRRNKHLSLNRPDARRSYPSCTRCAPRETARMYQRQGLFDYGQSSHLIHPNVSLCPTIRLCSHILFHLFFVIERPVFSPDLVEILREKNIVYIKKTFQMKLNQICNVGIDKCDWSAEGLATTGVGSCYFFLVIVNQGQHVFHAHWADALVASEVDEHHVVQHLEEVAKVLPRSTNT